ncbi:Lrp/AsnC family transcriptional regulator [Candidatus Auribacterota bacterium]
MDEILEILENNAKLTSKEIATMIGKDERSVIKAIKKYEDQGIILKYKTLINEEVLGKTKKVKALIEVTVTPQKNAGFDAIAERIYHFPEVISCYLLSGGFDLLLIVEGNDIHEVGRFIAEKLSCMEHVGGTSTHFILKKYKENGDILKAKEKDKRISISP